MENMDRLVIGLKDGDKAVFEEIYREYYIPLCYSCLRYLDNIEDAEEVVQDVFVKLWEKHNEVVISTSLKSYLHRAVHNNALNYIKKQGIISRYKHGEEKDHQGITHGDGQSSMEDEELRVVIKRAILELPEKRREIFELCKFEGMKYSKIADKLSISVKTVENQMTKALKYLRVVLKDYSPIIAFAIEIYRNMGMPK